MAIELASIMEFSHTHCIGICAVLVPTNLCLAGATTALVAMDRSTRTLYTNVAVSLLPATILLLHVATWWAIGVVMWPTFILPILTLVCLANHAYAVIAPEQMRNIVIKVSKFSVDKYQQLVES